MGVDSGCWVDNKISTLERITVAGYPLAHMIELLNRIRFICMIQIQAFQDSLSALVSSRSQGFNPVCVFSFAVHCHVPGLHLYPSVLAWAVRAVYLRAKKRDLVYNIFSG
jgi:hypothetical protein